MRIIKRNRITIGVLTGWLTFPGTIHSFVDIVYRGIKSAALHLDANLLFGCGAGSPFTDNSRPAMPVTYSDNVDFVPVGPWNTDGLIVLGPLGNENLYSYFQGLIDSGFPVVYAGDHETGPSVVVDNEGGISQAVDHLVEHGHHDIAFITGSLQEKGDSLARFRGYKKSLEKHGIPFNPELITCGNNSTPITYQAVMDLIQRRAQFSAIVTNNDESAIGAMKALNASGLLVPQDIALIGFDDRLEARANIPLLTTIHHPMFEMGYKSLELIVQIIQGKRRPDTIIRIPTHLVIRESCGCFPGKIEAGEKTSIGNSTLALSENPADKTAPYIFNSSHYHENNSTWSQSSIARAMTETVYKEMQRLSLFEVECFCEQLIEAYLISLKFGDTESFRQTIQEISEHIISMDDDLFSWQRALSVLRDWTPALLKSLPHTLKEHQAEDLLHQARISINEMLRGQYSRLVMDETTQFTNISRMTSRFFAVHSEKIIFDVFVQDLPLFGVQHASVIYFQKDGSDPFARSEIKILSRDPNRKEIFSSREFPLVDFFPEDKPIQLAIIPLHGPDGVIGHVAFQSNDFSSLGMIVRQMAAALQSSRLYQEAIDARRLAEETNYLKSRFLSIVSHELRTPVNLIIGLSNMMLQEAGEQTNQDCLINRKDLERIYIGAEHLESLIRDVLDLAGNQIGELKLTLELFDLHEILAPLCEIGNQLAKDKDLYWTSDIPNQPLMINGDKVRLRQVVLNLINNSLKFTMRGGITMFVSRTDQAVEIRISDTGLGIPPDEQRMIFNEFQQSTRTTSRGFGGIGLGLSICRSLVEMHGGKIGVQSNGLEGSGSSFFFSLPLAETQPVIQDEDDYLLSTTLKIALLIKDTIQAENLKLHLERSGCSVMIFDPNQTQDWLYKFFKDPPDRIIMDLSITSEEGWGIMRLLSENPLTQHIPVLFYNLDLQANAGAVIDVNLLNKPVGVNDLVNVFFEHNTFKDINQKNQSRPILIVDDDEDTLELHARMIETLACGNQIMKARNGIEALEIIRSKYPIIILLDLIMPEMDGFTLLQEMQNIESCKNIPVIILSSQSLSYDDINRLNTSVVSVLRKGLFTMEETLQNIDSVLKRGQRSSTETRQIVLKAMLYIQHHYAEAVSRADIANYIGLSERHLTRCFSQEVGITPITYLNRFRIYQAKLLLLARKKAITEIALEVGFSNSGYFTRVFRDEVGMSPREYVQNEIA